MLEDVLRPKEFGEPNDSLRPLTLFCSEGLPMGEKGGPLWGSGLPRPERGELLKLPLLPTELIEGVREYRGGVLKCASGVGATMVGGRPRSLRCAGVNGMSARSSSVRKYGMIAMPTLVRQTSSNANRIQPRPFRIESGTLKQVAWLAWASIELDKSGGWYSHARYRLEFGYHLDSDEKHETGKVKDNLMDILLSKGRLLAAPGDLVQSGVPPCSRAISRRCRDGRDSGCPDWGRHDARAVAKSVALCRERGPGGQWLAMATGG